MKHAIRTHLRDFIAVAVLVVLAIVTVGYILEHQPAFTFGHSYYQVKAEFSEASAVTAGQGQSVTIAGVEVGLIGGVQLEHGQAVVTMDIFRKYAPIYRNATVLLRPRTPLKDMYLALDPGSASAGRIPDGGTLGLANTQPDIDVDQILSSLDADTRTYLLLLLSGGADAFNGKGATANTPSPATAATLAADFKRFAPLDRSALNFTKLLSQRSSDLRSAIHNLNLVASSLGGVDTQLASLVKRSNTDFQAIASQDQHLSEGISLLPGALQQTSSTLAKVQQFAAASGPALRQLEPFARDLGPALKALQPLARQTTPVIQKQLEPFASDPGIRRLAQTLAPAAESLAKAAPALSGSFSVLNKLVNTLAYQQSGGEPSYLYWGGWLAHNLDSLTTLQDAEGPIIQGQFLASCPSLNLLEVALQPGIPSLTPILDMLNAPDWSKITNCYAR
ncbi:MAG TPA: MlaD family protein [Solirubrobacteraceae bacterium]|nr:MlaD family protein [Solirubrobacteraceae bacterium]